MESNLSYYTRRANSERQAAMRAVTEEARQRRLDLAQRFSHKAASLAR